MKIDVNEDVDLSRSIPRDNENFIIAFLGILIRVHACLGGRRGTSLLVMHTWGSFRIHDQEWPNVAGPPGLMILHRVSRWTQAVVPSLW
jgi:hypothetical protein